jgi:hypothetical protein
MTGAKFPISFQLKLGEKNDTLKHNLHKFSYR